MIGLYKYLADNCDWSLNLLQTSCRQLWSAFKILRKGIRTCEIFPWIQIWHVRCLRASSVTEFSVRNSSFREKLQTNNLFLCSPLRAQTQNNHTGPNPHYLGIRQSILLTAKCRGTRCTRKFSKIVFSRKLEFFTENSVTELALIYLAQIYGRFPTSFREAGNGANQLLLMSTCSQLSCWLW